MRRKKPPAPLGRYCETLHKLLPHYTIGEEHDAPANFDGFIILKTGKTSFRYLVEEKSNLHHLDIEVVIDQIRRPKDGLYPLHAGDRFLLLAPYVRSAQAAALQRAEIDYLDLIGNAHLKANGLFVHVEGRKPLGESTSAVSRPNKGWIRTVMAILIRPELANSPYRVLSEHADVALGTVAACMKDLDARGLLTGGRGQRRVNDHHALIALWVQGYVEGLRPSLGERRFRVRANSKSEILDRLRTALTQRGERWALTGADAAENRAHFYRAGETEIYASIHAVEDRDLQKALVAQPAARDSNLVVIEPPGPLAIPAEGRHDLPLAPPLLAYAELRYRGTEQALEAASMLLPEVLENAH